MVLPLRTPGLALALCVAALGASCDRGEGGVHVVVDGPLQPGADFDRLTLVAYLQEDRTPLYSETVEGDALHLPFTFNLTSGPGTPAGTKVEVLASAERASEVVSAIRGSAELKTGTGSTLTLTLPALHEIPDAGATPELCDDGVDDDGDGLADCADPDCNAKACQTGGLTCQSGACGCAGGVVGAYGQELSGFAARKDAAALTLQSGPRAGWILIAGGSDEAAALDVVELYQPTSVQLETYALSKPSAQPAAVEVANGSVWLLGGSAVQVLTLSGSVSANAYPLSPAATFTPSVALPWGEGALLVDDRYVRLDRAPDAGAVMTWSDVGASGATRDQAARIGTDAVVTASGPNATDTTELLTAEGVTAGPSLPKPVASAAVAPLPSNRVLVAGGTESGAATAKAFILKVQGTTMTLRAASPLPVPMSQPRAIALGNGWVYVEDQLTHAAAFFDPGAEKFVSAPTPQQAVSNEAWAPLPNAVFKAGGATSGGTVTGTATTLELKCP